MYISIVLNCGPVYDSRFKPAYLSVYLAVYSMYYLDHGRWNTKSPSLFEQDDQLSRTEMEMHFCW